MEPSIKDIQELLRIFLDSELQDLRVEIGNVRLAVSRRADPNSGSEPEFRTREPQAQEPEKPKPVPPKREGWLEIAAPSVGTFYRCPAPHQPPYVQVGSEVKTGDTLCLIEVMKMFTGVIAPNQGRVVEILVEDATLVEHGQPLMYLEPL
jgi:acetyl-CoA carboxylase biotin carboxyl carrier protein